MLESVDVLAIAAAAAAAIYDSVLVLGVTHVCCPNSCCETHVPAAVNCTYPCHQPRLLSTQQELKSTVLSANLKAHPTPLPPPPHIPPPTPHLVPNIQPGRHVGAPSPPPPAPFRPLLSLSRTSLVVVLLYRLHVVQVCGIFSFGQAALRRP